MSERMSVFWTPADRDRLAEMLRDPRRNWDRIAQKLGRTAAACQLQAKAHGLMPPRTDLWTPEEERRLIALVNEGKTPLACARALKTKRGRVRMKISKLRRLGLLPRHQKSARTIARQEYPAGRPFRDDPAAVEARWARLMGDQTFEDVRVRPEPPYREISQLGPSL